MEAKPASDGNSRKSCFGYMYRNRHFPLCPCGNSWRLRETEDEQGIVGGMHVKKPVSGLSRAEHGSRDHRTYRVCEVAVPADATYCAPRSLQSRVPASPSAALASSHNAGETSKRSHATCSFSRSGSRSLTCQSRGFGSRGGVGYWQPVGVQ